MSTRRATARRGARMSATRNTAERHRFKELRNEHADEQRARDSTREERVDNARSCSLRRGRSSFRGARRPHDHQADGRDHPDSRDVRLRVGPVPYRGLQPIAEPTPMGHEYCGVVKEVGSAVRTLKPGQFVIGSFFASDNTCPHCRAGYQSSCQQREFVGGAQAPVLRVPLADGTLVATPEVPPDDLLPSLLALSDVMGTGWFAADAANVKPGATVAVVGDGAVGLLGILSAKIMGAERIIAMSRHEHRQKLAREFGATDIVIERGDEGVARIKDMTDGVG